MSNVIQFKSRIQLLDALRGFALCGIIFMNIPTLLKIPWETLSIEKPLYDTFNILLKTKFYTIFSFLFGVGTYIFMQNAKHKTERTYLLYIKRLLFLFTAGLVHWYFHPGEALSMYGFLGFLLIPAFRLKPIFNFIIVIGCLSMTGVIASSQFSILCMFYLGYWVAQIGFFTQIKRYRILLTCLIILCGTGAYYSNMYLIPAYLKTNEYFKILALTGIVQSIGYMSIIVLLYDTQSFFRKSFNIFAPMGQIAFTNYIMQTVLILVIGHIYQLFETTYFSTAVWISTGILLFQLIYSAVYVRYFSIGPLEKVWRTFTYSPFLLNKKNHKRT